MEQFNYLANMFAEVQGKFGPVADPRIPPNTQYHSTGSGVQDIFFRALGTGGAVNVQ